MDTIRILSAYTYIQKPKIKLNNIKIIKSSKIVSNTNRINDYIKKKDVDT